MNKRSIKKFKNLNGKYVHKKNKTEIIEEKQEEIVEEKIEVKNEQPYTPKISPFQLVVIKLPWYKRAIRSLLGLLGCYYE